MLSDFQKSEFLKYHNLGYKDSEICSRIGATYGQVNWYRRCVLQLSANIGRKTQLQEQKIWNLFQQGISLDNISKRTGINKWSVVKFLRTKGIKNCRRAHTFQPKLGPREKSIILGIMLGDGSMYKDTANNVRIQIRHCKQQKLYCDYIYHTLKHLRPTIKNIAIKGCTINNKEVLPSIQTEVRLSLGKVLLPMYEEFYSTGKKVIPWSLMKHYTAESLAFHFMDDGSKTEQNGKINGFILSTNGFTWEEAQLFTKFLLGRFNLECSVNKCQNKPIIRIHYSSVNRFINLVKPFILSSFNYKICPSKTPLNGEIPVMENPVLNPQEIEENA